MTLGEPGELADDRAEDPDALPRVVLAVGGEHGRRRGELSPDDADRPGGRRGTGERAHDQAEEGLELGPRVRLARDRLGEHGDGHEAAVRLLDDGRVETHHAPEVVVDRRGVGAREAADLLAGGSLEALLGEDPARRLEELLARAWIVRRRPGGPSAARRNDEPVLAHRFPR